jgi:hopanoid biosynthesis associated protein HpnK
MVAGAAVSDALAVARRLPELRVGLHLVLVEGAPMLPPERIPDLVTRNGRLRTDLGALGAAIFLRPSVRRQVQAEITAQFEAFTATGLQLDHVNAHKHFHVHPTVASLLLEIGPRYGMRSVRAPVEPRGLLDEIEPGAPAPSEGLARFWALRLAARAKRARVAVADRVFGNRWSGAMTARRLETLVQRLPEGVTEIYMHPATRPGFDGADAGYRYAEELDALSASGVADALRESGAVVGGYADAGAA